MAEDKNWGAGYGFTDKDFIEELGLDPALEGSEAINKAIQKSVHDQLVRHYVSSGVPEHRAQKIAMREIRKKK